MAPHIAGGIHAFHGDKRVWAALVAALATTVLGFLWYLLFARPWMVWMGYDPDVKARLGEMPKVAGPMYVLSPVASVLSAAVLGKIIAIATVSTVLYGMKIGLAVWLGFVSTVQLTNAVFSKQPAELCAINTGYRLVCYVVMGAILGAWRYRASGGDRYSVIRPLVRSASLEMSCSTHQFWSSSTIFSVEHGSQ